MAQSIKCSVRTCLKAAAHHCAHCKLADYCSASCQKADWPTHKPNCRRPLGLSLAGMEAVVKHMEALVGANPAALRAKTTDWVKYHVTIPRTGLPAAHALPCAPAACALPRVAPHSAYCGGCHSPSTPAMSPCSSCRVHVLCEAAAEACKRGHAKDCAAVCAAAASASPAAAASASPAAAGGGAAATPAAATPPSPSAEHWFSHPSSCVAGGSCGESYVEQQRREHPEHVGRCNVFLSHAYDYSYLDVLDAVRAWEAKQRARGAAGPFFYYFDLFINNQHGAGNVPFEVLRDTFGKNVQAIGQTVLVLKWGNTKQTLGRLWCVFELWTTQRVRAGFDVAMTPEDRDAFMAALVHDYESLAAKTYTIDVESATALKDADKANIRRVINESGGFIPTNQLVIGAMQGWMVGEAGAELERRKEVAGRPPGVPAREWAFIICLMSNLACLLKDQGKSEEGEALFRDVREECTRQIQHGRAPSAAINGALIPLKLSATNGLAVTLKDRGTLLKDQGNLDEAKRVFRQAEKLYREALEVRKEMLGPKHLKTLESISNLGVLQAMQDKPGEAEESFRQALKGRREAKGCPLHALFDSINNLANALMTQLKHDEAFPLFKEAMTLTSGLDARNPLYLRARLSFGTFLARHPHPGMLAEAAKIFSAVLESMRRTFGEDHPFTKIARDNHEGAQRELDARAQLSGSSSVA